jgi:hypothetical protein
VWAEDVPLVVVGGEVFLGDLDITTLIMVIFSFFILDLCCRYNPVDDLKYQ